MIKSFRHRGLKRLYENGDGKRLPATMLTRITDVLSALDAADQVTDLDVVPGWRLHRLHGKLAGVWSISVSGNWRITFQFDDGDAYDVDFMDYH